MSYICVRYRPVCHLKAWQVRFQNYSNPPFTWAWSEQNQNLVLMRELGFIIARLMRKFWQRCLSIIFCTLRHINYYQECLLLLRMFELFFSVDGEMELQDNSRSVRDPSPNSETSKLFRIFDKLRNNPKILLACLSLAGIIQGMIFTNVVISRLLSL